MPQLTIILEGDSCWPDLTDKMDSDQLIWLDGNEGKPIQIALLKGGMQSGADSVSIRFDLPDGRVVVAETSLRLFLSCASAFRVKTEMTDVP